MWNNVWKTCQVSTTNVDHVDLCGSTGHSPGVKCTETSGRTARCLPRLLWLLLVWLFSTDIFAPSLFRFLKNSLHYFSDVLTFTSLGNKLLIVTGRHKNTPRNKRFSLLCPDRKFADEYLYNFECTHLKEKRSQLIDRRFLNDQSDIARCSLFNSLDVNHLKQLAHHGHMSMITNK